MIDLNSLYNLSDRLCHMVLAAQQNTGQIVYANTSLLNATGYGLEEITHLAVTDLYPVLRRERVSALLGELAEGQKVCVEEPFLLADGTTLPVETYIVRQTFLDKSYFILISWDMRDRLAVDDRLAAIHALNQSIIREAPIGIITFDREGRTTQVNAAHLRINRVTDHSPEDFLGVNLLYGHPTVERNGAGELLRGILAGRAFEHEFEQFVTRSGEIISVRVYGVPLYDPSGAINGGLVLVEDITEHKRAERRLAHSEARYRLLLDALPDLIFRIHKDGTLIDYQGAASSFYLPPSEFLGKPLAAMPLEPALIQQITTAITSACETGSTQLVEYHLPPENTASTYEARIIPSLNDEVLLVVRDITERKRAEQALRESEATVRALLNASPDVALLLTADFTVLAANEIAAARFNKTVDEMIGLRIHDLLPPDLAAQRQQWAEQVVATGRPVRFEDERGGRFFDNFVSPVFDSQGRVYRLAAFARDITEQKRAEETLRQQYDLAEARASQLDAIYQASRSILSTLDRDEVLDRLLQHLESVVHYHAANVMLVEGNTARIVKCRGYETYGFSAEYMNRVTLQIDQTPLLQAMFRTHRPQLCTDARLDPRWVWTPESQSWLRAWLGTPIVIHDTVVGFFSLDSAIPGFYTHEHARLVETFAQLAAIALEQAAAFANIQELERVKSDMIRMASHDLRNPLNRVQAYTEALRDQLESSLTPSQANYFQTVEKAIREMKQIIGDILSLERIESRYRVMEPIAWCDLVNQVVDSLQEDAAVKKHYLTVDCSPAIPDSLGDPAQISHALYNLIHNAIKYTPPEGLIQVRVMTQQHGAQAGVAVEIRDTGVGMAREKQHSLFQPVDHIPQPGAQSIKGLGLGLSVVKAAVERHKGHVYYHADSGGGSLFGFWLPLP